MRAKKRGLSWDEGRKLALAFDGVEDSTSYGTPALKRKKTLIIRLKEDGETIVLRCEHDARDTLMRLEPETFFVTDHYVDYPWVLVRLAGARADRLKPLIADAWAAAAPKT